MRKADDDYDNDDTVFGQNKAFLLLWESSENQFVRPKKIEKILDPP